ncbi:MAG: hypothetical protein PHC88_08545 [Terrimicrobiaceae bacterium]|nr:hypothetical protein [Terrimicrobiaceae bacterium]
MKKSTQRRTDGACRLSKFALLAEAAMHRVARQVTAENKRLGLPLVVSAKRARRSAPAR